MAGHMALDHAIGVRVPVSQQKMPMPSLRRTWHWRYLAWLSGSFDPDYRILEEDLPAHREPDESTYSCRGGNIVRSSS